MEVVSRVGTAGEQGQVKKTLPDRRVVYSINRGWKKWRRDMGRTWRTGTAMAMTNNTTQVHQQPKSHIDLI